MPKLLVVGGNGNALAWASGGENLSSKQVSSLPVNERDFDKLLLLAAGTMTETNGTANFTQQYAVNGQRATTTLFATDGIDSTDPEMGGAAFANYNVDAIQEVNQSSGVLPASIDEGQCRWRYGAKPWRFRNAGPQHIPRSRVPRLRSCSDQGHAFRAARQGRTGHFAISC